MAFALVNNNGKMTKEEFNPEFVEFRPPKVLDHGGKIIGLSYKGGPLKIQTPWMTMPYGMSVYEDPNGTQKYSVDFSFGSKDGDEGLERFHEQMNGLQAKLIQSGIDNSVAWFKKKMSPAVITEFFTPIVKKSKDKETGEPDGKYPDTLKFKLDCRNGEFRCKAFTMDREMIDEPLDTLLTKGTRVSSIINPAFLWFAGGKFGVTIKAEQMRVKTVPRNDVYGFVDDEEDMEAEEETTTTESQFVEDDEEEEEVEVPVASEPAKPAARGRRRRKAEA